MNYRGIQALTAVILSFWTVQTMADTIIWSGLGANGKWSTPENWTDGILPSDTDTVEFGSGFDSGNIHLDAPQTVAGIIINNSWASWLYFGATENALTLNGNIKRLDGTSHLAFTCPVVVNDTLTITNEAIGITTFTKTFTSAHDIIFQDDIGTHLEFKENNRATFSGDIYIYGASKNNVIASYKDGGFGTGDIYMYGCTMLKFRGEAQSISNNIAFKGARAVEWGSETTDAFYDHVGNITTDEVIGNFLSLKGTRTTVRLSGNNTGPTGSRMIFHGSSTGPDGKYILGSTAALSWGCNIIGGSDHDIKMVLEDGIAITNGMMRIRDDKTSRVTIGNEIEGATNLISTILNLGDFGVGIQGNRTIRLVSGTNSLVSFTGHFYESHVDDVMNIVKDGPGAISMSYANNYKGTTIVSNGTLLANNTTGSATSTNTVTVCGGGVLGGSGSVAGSVTVEAGGAVAPGDSVGQLTAASVTFEENTSFIWDYGASSIDLLLVTGDLTLPQSMSVTVNNASGDYLPYSGRVLMECQGTLSGTPAGWTIAEPNSLRLSDDGQKVLVCGPVRGTLIMLQ